VQGWVHGTSLFNFGPKDREDLSPAQTAEPCRAEFKASLFNFGPKDRENLSPAQTAEPCRAGFTVSYYSFSVCKTAKISAQPK